jgi:hypothetical protein
MKKKLTAYDFFVEDEANYKRLFDNLKNLTLIATLMGITFISLKNGNGSLLDNIVVSSLLMFFFAFLLPINILHAMQHILAPYSFGRNAERVRTLAKRIGWRKFVFSYKTFLFMFLYFYYFTASWYVVKSFLEKMLNT